MAKIRRSTKGTGGYNHDNACVAFGDGIYDPGKWNRERKKVKPEAKEGRDVRRDYQVKYGPV